eukprot:12946687-Alexandrium_andersonii.AAC.1
MGPADAATLGSQLQRAMPPGCGSSCRGRGGHGIAGRGPERPVATNKLHAVWDRPAEKRAA